METKVKGYGLLALGLLLTLLFGILAFSSVLGFRPDPALSDGANDALEQRLAIVRVAALLLMFVGRWVWRKGRRIVDPSWVPRKSFRLSSRKSSARATPPRPDQAA